MAAVDAPLKGRLALVTGGAGCIGQAVCHILASKGVAVVVADKNVEAAKNFVRCLPGEAKHQAMYVDVSDPLSVEQLFTGIGRSFSMPLSIVVHCAGGGAIVNISSLAAKCGSSQSCAYAAATAGIVALTKSAALELATHGIRCNVVIPGWVESPFMAIANENSKSAVVSATQLKRTAQPKEIAEAIAPYSRVRGYPGTTCHSNGKEV
ncbi:(3R)-3-hydroxyacyl-CoA dehydrogenase-like [Rhipicephalus microplus]|uniref:(3R)-3-hydroxyacyl-CoA dehydrogenase-like n=1 Tax=Rhipicephalus microplus TaxID=6941 RepID=UPI003F6D423C